MGLLIRGIFYCLFEGLLIDKVLPSFFQGYRAGRMKLDVRGKASNIEHRILILKFERLFIFDEPASSVEIY